MIAVTTSTSKIKGIIIFLCNNGSLGGLVCTTGASEFAGGVSFGPLETLTDITLLEKGAFVKCSYMIYIIGSE